MKRCLIAYAHNLFYCLSICSDGVVMKKKVMHYTLLFFQVMGHCSFYYFHITL